VCGRGRRCGSCPRSHRSRVVDSTHPLRLAGQGLDYRGGFDRSRPERQRLGAATQRAAHEATHAEAALSDQVCTRRLDTLR
jgi:hypothetical protein